MEKVCEAVLMEIDIEKFRKAMAEIDTEEASMKKMVGGGMAALVGGGMAAMVAGGMEKARPPMGTGMKKIDINEVRKAASSHYKGLTADQRKAAERLFKDMDKDDDKLISVEEFRTFLTQAGFQTDNCDCVFRELDKDNSGTLEFDELVTFFYVLSCDEIKPESSRANTGGPDRKATPPSQATGNTKSTEWKAENGRPTGGANDGRQRLIRSLFSPAFYKHKEEYKLG